MRQILFLLLCCMLYNTGALQAQAIIRDLHQQARSLDSLQGKKVLVMILPLQQDTATVNQLFRFQQRYSDSVKVIGLVCLDSCQATADALAGIYAPAIQAGAIVTEGIVAAGPVTEMVSVLGWLSGKNIHNRQEEPGITGSKYFLSRQGRLYAQVGAASSLDGQLVDNITRIRVPGEH